MSTAGHAELFAPPAADSESRKNLVGLDRAELTAELQQVGEPAFRARQLWHWIYHRGLTDFAAMTNALEGFRARLAARYVIERPSAVVDRRSIDGTRKWLLRSPTVRRPKPSISRKKIVALFASPPGRLHADLPLLPHRHPAPGAESFPIGDSGQVMLARDALGEWPSPPDGRLISNIVLMGMGEPLYNYEQRGQGPAYHHGWGGHLDLQAPPSRCRPPAWHP